MTPWSVSNVVFHFDYGKRFLFKTIMCNKDFSYEPELFPAALISKWHPSHITLFPNGKGMLTGVKNHSDALMILDKLSCFLCHNDCHR